MDPCSTTDLAVSCSCAAEPRTVTVALRDERGRGDERSGSLRAFVATLLIDAFVFGCITLLAVYGVMSAPFVAGLVGSLVGARIASARGRGAGFGAGGFVALTLGICGLLSLRPFRV